MGLHSIFCYPRLSVAATGKLIRHKLWRYFAVVLLKHGNACSHLHGKLKILSATPNNPSSVLAWCVPTSHTFLLPENIFFTPFKATIQHTLSAELLT